MSQTETNKKEVSSCVELQHCGNNHNYKSKSKTKRLLDIPFLNTQIYGTKFNKYNCIKDWNIFRNNFANIPLHQCTYTLVKNLVKDFLFSKY